MTAKKSRKYFIHLSIHPVRPSVCSFVHSFLPSFISSVWWVGERQKATNILVVNPGRAMVIMIKSWRNNSHIVMQLCMNNIRVCIYLPLLISPSFLRQVHSTFGVVTSFTGTYRADEWSLVVYTGTFAQLTLYLLRSDQLWQCKTCLNNLKQTFFEDYDTA